MTSEVTALLFRAAQEAIRNVVAHSDARLVSVEGRSWPTAFAVLQIEDDGRGFNDVDPGPPPGRMGTSGCARWETW